AKDTLCIGALLHRRQIFDWKHHALVLISYVKNLRNRRSLLVPLRGFTLAEVLITLGIIGVVAALTIPTLMQKIDERETVSKLKKAYSTLTNAYSLISAEKGEPTKWLQTNEDDEIGNIFAQYLNVAKNCGTASGCLNSAPYYSLDGSLRPNNDTRNNLAKLALTDGTSVAFRFQDPSCSAEIGNTPTYSTRCGFIVVNINNGKGDNIYGKNVFEFNLTKNGIVPYGAIDDTNTPFETNCVAENADGGGCTAWVLYNENMDYLHCHDLSWSGKTKCN
ncbi:type II secretion system protein, partial [bacterium]|nr:type II secretion system protein [bacterium]